MQDAALYMQIYGQMLQAIRDGEYAENAPLPSERQLCDKYHVSRSTIRQAMLLLKEMELVYTVQGNGTFVKPQMYTQSLSHFTSFGASLKKSNVLMENRIVAFDTVITDAALARKTGHPVGTPFHRLVRLRFAKEYPLMLEATYLPCARFTALNTDLLSRGSLHEFLRHNFNFCADSSRETLRAVMPTAEERQLLRMPPNTPCMLLERFGYEGGNLIEYTASTVRGDKYIFHVDLHHPTDGEDET